jgi:AcrR family transcriptional regulator
VAKGTPYLYFASKAEVIAALRTRQVRRMLDACDAATHSAGSAPEAVDRFVTAAFAATVADAPLLEQLFHASGGGQHEVAMMRDALSAHIEAGIAAGELRPADPAAAATFLAHGMRGVFAEALHAGESRHAAAVDAVRAMAAAILAPGGRGRAVSRGGGTSGQAFRKTATSVPRFRGRGTTPRPSDTTADTPAHSRIVGSAMTSARTLLRCSR